MFFGGNNAGSRHIYIVVVVGFPVRNVRMYTLIAADALSHSEPLKIIFNIVYP